MSRSTESYHRFALNERPQVFGCSKMNRYCPRVRGEIICYLGRLRPWHGVLPGTRCESVNPDSSNSIGARNSLDSQVMSLTLVGVSRTYASRSMLVYIQWCTSRSRRWLGTLIAVTPYLHYSLLVLPKSTDYKPGVAYRQCIDFLNTCDTRAPHLRCLQ